MLNRGRKADLPLLRTLLAICQKSQEPSFWKLMESFVLLVYTSLAVSRTLLHRLLAHLNFTLDSEDFSFWYKRKKWFLWTMAAAQAAENHGDEWCLTWYFRWGICTSFPTCTHSQNSLAAAEALSLKISSHWRSLNVHVDRPNQQENSHKQCDEMGHPIVNMMKVKGNWDNNMIRISQWRKSHNPKEQDCEIHSLGYK